MFKKQRNIYIYTVVYTTRKKQNYTFALVHTTRDNKITRLLLSILPETTKLHVPYCLYYKKQQIYMFTVVYTTRNNKVHVQCCLYYQKQQITSTL